MDVILCKYNFNQESSHIFVCTFHATSTPQHGVHSWTTPITNVSYVSAVPKLEVEGSSLKRRIYFSQYVLTVNSPFCPLRNLSICFCRYRCDQTQSQNVKNKSIPKIHPLKVTYFILDVFLYCNYYICYYIQ